MSAQEWTSSPFLDQAQAWVAEQLVAHDRVLTGEWAQPHCRPWSSALSYETDRGRVWFKVNGPGTRHEARLVALLGRLTPGLAPEVLAADDARCWSLCLDAGPQMRELAPPDGLWDAWRGVLVSYAEAQIELSQRRREILATGLPEVSPTTSPVLARELLDDLARQPADEGGLNAEQVAAVEARLPEFDDWCAELAASGIPDSVEHNDLHSANVCVRTPSGSHAAEVRIIDWGDAHWGHPLGTMLATLNSMAYHVGVFEDGQPIKDARVLRMRDAYLEPFTRFDSHANLVRYVDLARRTGCLGKALANRSALMGEPVATHAEYEFPVREWFLGITQ